MEEEKKEYDPKVDGPWIDKKALDFNTGRTIDKDGNHIITSRACGKTETIRNKIMEEENKIDSTFKVYPEIPENSIKIDQLDDTTKTVAEVPEGIRIFKSNKPYRLIDEGETFEEYKQRQKIIKKAEKERAIGVNLFVSNPQSKKGKGKIFRKSNYTPEQLGSAEVTALAKLKGIDLEKIDNK